MPAPLPCPECEQIDAVRKISAINKMGFSNHTVRDYSSKGNYTSSVVVEQSPMSKLFDPPLPQKAKSGYEGIAMVLSALVVLVALFDLSVSVWVGQILLIICVGIASICAYIFIWLFVHKHLFKSENEQRALIQAELDARWERVRPDLRWENTYYCERCNGIYVNEVALDNEQRSLLPSELVHALYWLPELDLDAIWSFAVKQENRLAVYSYKDQTNAPLQYAEYALNYLRSHDYCL